MTVEENEHSATGHSNATCNCGEPHPEIPEDVMAIIVEREKLREAPEEFIHERVPLLGFEVDAALEQLVTNLWIIDMPVDHSCQGYSELCHINLRNNQEYHTNLHFMRANDGMQFFKIFTEIFGSGAAFDGTGISLTNTDGDLSELDPEKLGSEEYVRQMIAMTSAELSFNPEFVIPIVDALDNYISSTPVLEDRRSMLEVAEDLDDAYSILEVDDSIREQAEAWCSC